MLSPKQQEKLTAEAEAILAGKCWTPQEGPQTECYYSKADEILYGGAAGGGKSHLLLGLALNEGKESVIFRNGLGNLRDLENEAVKTMGHREGFNQQVHYWRLPKDRGLEFASLEQPGSELNHQGRRRDFMGFDEAAQMLKERVQFVMGWSTGRVIFATNPPLSDEGNWIVTWFAPWLDPMFANPAKANELRWFVNDKRGDPLWVDGPGRYDLGDGIISTAKSRTFIPSRLADNRYLRDTDYKARVEALPEPMRSAMLNGNFMAARIDHANQIFPSDWLRQAQARWKEEGAKQPMIAIGADIGTGNPDPSALARLHVGNWFDRVIRLEGVDTKDGPAVGAHIIRHVRNGASIAADMTGGWGGAVKEHLRQAEIPIFGLVFSTKTGAVDPNSKIPYANLRAEMYWNFRIALDPNSGENVALPPDARILAQGSAPRWKMQGGAIYVESKDDIRSRLGSSTDELDAIVMAWHIRASGLAKRALREKPTSTDPQESNPYAIAGYS